MAAAAGLAIAGFTALGSIFDYPKILKEPTAEILASYRAHQAAVTGWFLVLVISAALLAPVGVLLGRLAGGRLGRWIAGLGIAAATVQVIGLSRWVLLVPGVSDDATDPVPRRRRPPHLRAAAHLARQVLGETIGYALTATFTVLVVIGVARSIAPRGWRSLGYASAGADRHRRPHPARARARRASPTSSATSPGACGSSPWPSVLWRAPAAVPAPITRRASPAASAAS